MIDKYNRAIDYIRISVTDRCNLRCVYCMPEQGVDFVPHENIITFEEIIKLCEYFGKLGISKVKITGGEPLVRKNLPYLIKKIKEVPGINNVTLTTNGILLKEQMNSLAEAGLDAINISLDTLDEKSFENLTRFPYLNKVMEGMEEALKYKEIPVKINCVPIKAYNSNESILEMIELARFNNVHIRYIQMMPIGPSKTLTSISEEEIKTLITDTYGDMLHYEYSLGNGPSRYYSGGVNLKDLLRAGVLEEEILELIRKGIYNKPKKHQFESVTTTLDTLSNHSLEHCNMSQIGG
ncbi:MAG: moaA2 [Anaerocolumna sp.]|nr:moaA2 [Anaerocolumna sp.]